MVTVQILAELEEVIQYNVVRERRDDIKLMWWERLKGCVNRIEDWQKILQTRSIVLSRNDDVRTYLKFASLCRKNGRLKLSKKTLSSLIGSEPDIAKPLPASYPQVTYAFTKHLWSEGERATAFWFVLFVSFYLLKYSGLMLTNTTLNTCRQLKHFVKNTLMPQLSLNMSVPPGMVSADSGVEVEQTVAELRKLLARCCLRLGEWQESLEGLKENVINQVLRLVYSYIHNYLNYKLERS